MSFQGVLNLKRNYVYILMWCDIT